MTHHKNLGSYEFDLDLKNKKGFKIEDELTKKVILRHVITPLIGLHLRHYLGINMTQKDGYSILTLKIVLIISASLFVWFEPLAAFLFLVVPYVWIFTAINYWTDCIDHGGLLNQVDDSTKSRNVIVPKWIRVIFFPRNDCFHLVHHLFPAVPVKHFEFCNEVLNSNKKIDDADQGAGIYTDIR